MAEDSFTLILIYGLCDPRSGCLRYIGQSKRLHKRFWRHCNPQPHDRSHRGCWLRGLRNAGLEPDLVVLEEATSATAAIIEAFWIASLRAAGADLVNTTDGEQAPSRRGYALTPEHRAKISAAHIGIRPDATTREKMRAARKNYRWSEATRTKISNTRASKCLHPKPVTHNTPAAYQRGCRCDACVAAIRASGTVYRQRKSAARPPRPLPQHGTTATYWSGCRCNECKAVAASYVTARKKLRGKESVASSESVLVNREVRLTLRRNRALELVRQYGHVSTLMLAHEFGLSTSTFESVMRTLVAEGVLRAAGNLGYVLVTRIRARQMPRGRLAPHHPPQTPIE